MGPVCGYPLGLAYNPLTRQLIIADAYLGLLTAGPDGRLAKPLATAAEGVPFVATNAVDVDPLTGNIYFTDCSTRYQIRNYRQALLANDATGRLMKYDVSTGQVTVLLSNLGFPTGVALSGDGSVVLVSEATRSQLTRLWLKGPRANTAEVVLSDVVEPDNIRRDAGSGDLFIAARRRRVGLGLGLPSAARDDSDLESICLRLQREQNVRETPSFEVNLVSGSERISECQGSGLDVCVTSMSARYKPQTKPK
ncbi:unnamed protein product [Linum tenue]|uniref:Strictosidine synthase conserved region domain-containing protein n=1 Tax=Linum tenue TaxID=586396 RepID=A0AAV0IT18_9ROSI|nr:unnamed protein product [Linum tenue]